MKRVYIGFVMVTCLGTLYAQYEQYEEPIKLNTNIGLIVTAPLSPTSRVANIGWGAVIGAGYNFSRRHAAIGELMWNRLYPTDEALRPINATLPAPVDGNTDLFAVTGNYRLELRGDRYGSYFIGGGGWYFRHSNLSARCRPA